MTTPESSPEFESGLKDLNRLFAGALGDAKAASAFAALGQIRTARSTQKKIEALEQEFQKWSEDSAVAIKKWFPKYVELAQAWPEEIDLNHVKWAEDQVWGIAAKVSSVRKPGSTHFIAPGSKPDCSSRAGVWWFAVATEGNSDVNMPPDCPSKPWKVPRWLAQNRDVANGIIKDHLKTLSLRFHGAIQDAILETRVAGAIKRVPSMMLSSRHSTSSTFVHSEDYRAITVNGVPYALTTNQALVIQELHEANENGLGGVSNIVLLQRLGNPASRIRDSFRSGDGPRLWNTLVTKVKGPRGMYRLNLPATR